MASKPSENLIETTISYVDLDENGEPVERHEKWYLHVTFRTLSAMYKRLGVNEERARELAEDVQDGKRDEDEFDRLASQEIDVPEQEAIYHMVWGAMKWHADKRGRDLTPEDVGDMLTPENAENVALQMRRAMHLFETGEYLTEEEMRERIDQEDQDARDAAGEDGQGKSPRASGEPAKPRP